MAEAKKSASPKVRESSSASAKLTRKLKQYRKLILQVTSETIPTLREKSQLLYKFLQQFELGIITNPPTLEQLLYFIPEPAPDPVKVFLLNKEKIEAINRECYIYDLYIYDEISLSEVQQLYGSYLTRKAIVDNEELFYQLNRISVVMAMLCSLLEHYVDAFIKELYQSCGVCGRFSHKLDLANRYLHLEEDKRSQFFSDENMQLEWEKEEDVNTNISDTELQGLTELAENLLSYYNAISHNRAVSYAHLNVININMQYTRHELIEICRQYLLYIGNFTEDSTFKGICLKLSKCKPIADLNHLTLRDNNAVPTADDIAAENEDSSVHDKTSSMS